MQIFKTKKELQEHVLALQNNGKTIGFVPTMGALHRGHISLIEMAKLHTDICVVSIFVNPTQFNDAQDLKKYPRDINKDIFLLEQSFVDVLFYPSVDEMYPVSDHRVFDFNNLDKILEGRYRSGHFNGVAQVVSKLFDIIRPDKSFFGLKDYQQYLIVKQLVKIYMPHLNTEVVGCPIIRESDGLAMSSRNSLLDAEHRASAGEINKILTQATKLSQRNDIATIKSYVVKELNKVSYLKVEYFEIVDADEFTPAHDFSNNNEIGCIAVFCGKVRLIDNIFFTTGLYSS